SAWLMKDLTTRKSASQSFFTNMNKVAIPSPEERRNAELSIHDALIVAIGKTGRFTPPGGDFKYRFGFDSTAAHPSASIVDINQDGWDDFYFTARWGKNQLFVNQKDGTFKEEAAAYGLDILNHCTCAAFADFDNDGDPDVIVGRSYTHSMYLENRDGRFHDVSHEVFSRPLPAMVTAIAVADYNRDGLLDVYFSTYASGLTGELEKVFMTYEQQVILADKAAKEKDHEELLDALGPPNYLLVNRGDARFELAPENQQLEFWQPTLNAVWVDYDDDGDPDLYVSNDFGPDALMRNDHPKGFVNVTTTVGHPTMAGFGMGAGWGDYDLDGKQDLYVSNMYSKAGLRITEQVGKMDPRFVAFANGNRLYRQGEEGFEYTSGLEPPKHLVAKVGWSWGGQFVDFDNNGYLDIYVPTGYFTAPDAVAVEDDL
ncbi:MAG: VCBS repeat-containing protein, partial [Verrucomicrobiota bacterium]